MFLVVVRCTATSMLPLLLRAKPKLKMYVGCYGTWARYPDGDALHPTKDPSVNQLDDFLRAGLTYNEVF